MFFFCFLFPSFDSSLIGTWLFCTLTRWQSSHFASPLYRLTQISLWWSQRQTSNNVLQHKTRSKSTLLSPHKKRCCDAHKNAISTALHLILHLESKNSYIRMVFVDFSSAFITSSPIKLIPKALHSRLEYHTPQLDPWMPITLTYLHLQY